MGSPAQIRNGLFLGVELILQLIPQSLLCLPSQTKVCEEESESVYTFSTSFLQGLYVVSQDTRHSGKLDRLCGKIDPPLGSQHSLQWTLTCRRLTPAFSG